MIKTLAWCAAALPCLAQTSSSPMQGVEAVSRQVLRPGKAVLGELNQHGISFQGTGIYDWSKAISTADSESGFGRYSFDFGMAVDGKKLWGLNGSTALVRVRNHANNFGSDCVGAAQLYSNIDGTPRTTIYEAWIEQRIAERLRLKVGKIDANTEFAAVQTASDFLNSSMGYSPTIVAFPSYPEPKLGFNASISAGRSNALSVGIFQTAGAGAMLIAEPSHSWAIGQDEKGGRASFGYWHLGGRLTGFDGNTSSGTQGVYSVVEQALWRSSSEKRGPQKLSAFLQLGAADGRVSSYARHLGGGAVLQGTLRRRTQDSMGSAVTWVQFSRQTEAGFDLPGERIFETYYKFAISRHLALIQDFQFVHNGGGLRSNPDCSIITPRLAISF
jgi:carbohydrate-selective porin OprB